MASRRRTSLRGEEGRAGEGERVSDRARRSGRGVERSGGSDGSGGDCERGGRGRKAVGGLCGERERRGGRRGRDQKASKREAAGIYGARDSGGGREVAVDGEWQSGSQGPARASPE